MTTAALLVGGPAEGTLLMVPTAGPIVVTRRRRCEHTDGHVEIMHGRYVIRPTGTISPAFDKRTLARLFDWDGWQP